MKFAITLLSALVLMGCASAAENVPWQRPPYISNQAALEQFGQEMDYYPAYDEPGEEQDIERSQGFGNMQQFIQSETGEPTFSNGTCTTV